MTKSQFINQLKRHLSSIPTKEKDEILYDYEEHFSSGIAEGKSEEEICSSLGTVRTIAATIKADYFIDNAENSYKPKDIISAVFAAAALGFFNVVVVLGPFCSAASVIFSAWVVSFAFFTAGFGGAVLYSFLSLFNNGITWFGTFSGLSFTTVFFGLLSLGMTGIFLGLLCFYITRLFFRLTVRYLKWNLNFITLRRI
ncbi:MAG: DUF1700 domain-containing protein [Spirochaetes bacterium]|nr:DUF1700 domain-containing protein [Spirochaetota bacterium]